MPKLDMKTRREVMEYLRENNASPEEKRTVWQWVLLGRDIYDNPWYYAFAGGVPMELSRHCASTRNWTNGMSHLPRKNEKRSLATMVSQLRMTS